MKVSKPVIVGVSQPRETRWGHFQFPSLCRLPSAELMVTVNDADDATSGYGQPLKRYLSADEGLTWRPADQPFPGAGPHASCAEIFDGEYLVLPASKTLDVTAAGLCLPKRVGTTFAYGEFNYYTVESCQPALREYLTCLPAWRWTPARPAWTEERVAYEVPGHLCWTMGKEQAVAHTWFEHAPIQHRDELLYVDYRTNCLRDDGSTPQGWSCLLMASRDNGRSFHKRSVVAAGRVYEPMLSDTADGELVCAIRGADQDQRPMLITYSPDHGHTWEKPRDLFGFGVFPALVRLGNGVLLLAFGRPGIWVSASLDGSGRTWTNPVAVLAGDPKNLLTHSCGYTNLLPVTTDEALLVYSDFQHVDPAGQQCKSIEIRRIQVTG